MAAVQLGFEFAPPAAPTAGSQETSATPPTLSGGARQGRVACAQPQGHEQADARARPSAERADALQRALQARAVGTPLRLTITDNRRTMLSLRRRDVLIEVRLHHMFLRGDARIWDALGDYLLQADRSAGALIAHYIEQHRKHIRRVQRRSVTLSTSGKHHDLGEIFQAMNARYFAGAVDAHITWGRDAVEAPRAIRRSIKLGSYTSRDRLIRVHPALDAGFVPRFFVEYIVYHEMLHHVVPPAQLHGRRDLHGSAFKAREREFQDYHAALLWERENLARLLRSRTTRARRPSKNARSGY